MDAMHTTKPYAVTDGTSILGQFKTVNGAAGYLHGLKIGPSLAVDVGFYVARFDPFGWKSVWQKMDQQPVYNPHRRRS